MAWRGYKSALVGVLLVVVVACAPGDGDSVSSSTTGDTAPAATSTTTTGSVPDDLTIVDVVVREGRVVSEGRADVPLGNRISLRFDSDARLRVHVHGYEEEFEVARDGLATHEFQGDLPGIFEVEDHVTHRLLIELKISP